MANSLLDRVPNLPRAEDLDMRNMRNFTGPQPLPEAMRPNMRTNPDAQPRNPGMANPQARAAYSEMGRGTAPAQTAQPPVGNRDLLRDTGRRVGGAAAGLKNWAVGDRPEAKGWAGKGWNGVKGVGQAAARIGGAVQFGDTLQDNFNAMQSVASDPKSSLSDHFAGGVEMVGNTVASGVANLSKKMPYIGPAVAGYLGSDTASRFVETMAPGSSVLKKHGLGRGALMEAAGFSDPKSTQPPATQPEAAAPQAQPQAPVRDLDYEQQLQALGQSFEARPGMPRPDLGYGVHDRTAMTNEQVGDMNPQGRVTVTRGPNGTMEFSGNDVRGAVSYQDDQGKALAGGGLRGQGFSDFRVAPADSNVVMGPNGSYAYSNSPNLRDFSPGGNGVTGRTEYADGQVPQIIQDARRSQAESSARAQQLGVNIGGMAPWQANQYMDEVQQAQGIRAAQEANRNSYDYRLRQLADPTSDVSKAMRALTGNIPDQIKGRGRWVSDYQQKQMETARALAGDYLGETDRVRKDATTRYGTDVSSQDTNRRMDVDIRNTDVKAEADRYTADASRRSAAARLEYDRSVGERTYRDSRRDTTQKRLDDVFTTMADDGNGNVNPRRMAELRTAANSFVSESADALEKQGDLAGAKQLREAGVAALEDPSTMAMFTERMQIKDISSKGWLGHTNTKSNALPGVTRIEGDTVHLSDGSTMPYGAFAYQGGRLLPDRWGQYDPTSDRRMWSTTNNQR